MSSSAAKSSACATSASTRRRRWTRAVPSAASGRRRARATASSSRGRRWRWRRTYPRPTPSVASAPASTFPPDVRHAELFAALQAEARTQGRGLWGACATPEAPSPTTAAGACDYSGTDQPWIKGNISLTTGEKIYHVPGGYYYDDTVIDEAKGERWFCTEAEAVATGWRKSKR